MNISIIGAGNIGGAIARSLSKGSIFKSEDIAISDNNKSNLANMKAYNSSFNCYSSNRECIKDAEIIIMAVKPNLVEIIAGEISGLLNYDNQIIVSIAAGVPIEKLRSYFPANNGKIPTIFRVIPNTAIEVLESFSCIASFNASAEQEELIVNIFNEMGKSMVVPESLLNSYMSLSSCGIAYAFRYIRAAMVGGVEMGISSNIARDVVMQTLKGAVALLEANGTNPEVEIDKVTTPGGITIKGLIEMENLNFSTSVIKGLKASLLTE